MPRLMLRQAYNVSRQAIQRTRWSARLKVPARRGYVALNQLINVAVAEKLSALRTEDHFHRRAARANLPKTVSILKRAGAGNPPMKGDELRAKRGRR